MSYRIEPGETPRESIQRIANEQLDKTLHSLRDMPEGRDEAVHDARKRFKKIRALMRLVRDEIGEDVFDRENTTYRDAGRLLSDVRDAYSIMETVDDLTETFDDQLTPDALAGIQTALQKHYDDVAVQAFERDNVIDRVIDTVEDARPRMNDLPIERTDFSAFHDGMRRVYKRGRKGMAHAYDDPTAENFHEWRKRVKYLWYHLRIIRPVWDDVLDEWGDATHDLADYLGDSHDLSELRNIILSTVPVSQHEEEVRVLFALTEQHEAELLAQAKPIAQRIYYEDRDTFIERMAHYWDAWQHQQEVEAEVEPDLVMAT